VAKKVKVSDPTASAYLRILAAEGKVEISRKVGNAVFYREKRSPDKSLICSGFHRLTLEF